VTQLLLALTIHINHTILTSTMRTVLYFIMLALPAIFAQEQDRRGSMRHLDEIKASTPLARHVERSDSQRIDSNTTACEAPPVIKVLSEDEMLLIGRHAGFHAPCIELDCWIYCMWCGTSGHEHCDFYTYAESESC